MSARVILRRMNISRFIPRVTGIASFVEWIKVCAGLSDGGMNFQDDFEIKSRFMFVWDHQCAAA